MHLCVNLSAKKRQICALTISRDEGTAILRLTRPLSERCRRAMSPSCLFPSRKPDRQGRNLWVERLVSGKASVVAALLLPSTTQWGQRERAPWPPDTWRQKHRHGITESAGTALLPEPSSQTCSRPDRGYVVSKTASKAVLRKISLWLVRWEGERRMFVVSRWVSTDYMCGLALSGFW